MCHWQRNWPRFSFPKFCWSSIYVITFVKFSNRSIQILFNFLQRTSMDFCKVYSFKNCVLERAWEKALRESTAKLQKSNKGELRYCHKKSSSQYCACVKGNCVARWNHKVARPAFVTWESFALWSVVEPHKNTKCTLHPD